MNQDFDLNKTRIAIARLAAIRRRERLTMFAIVAAILVALAGIDIAWSVYAYGDWTCAFAECRKIKP